MLQLLYKRWTSATPAFFKKLFILSGLLTATATGLLPIKDELPKAVQDYIGYVITAGAVGTIFSKLTTTDSTLTTEDETK